MASTTHDEGFHEIQLNGKQLVFLFMAITVVSVVIFLCGVLVGRGFRGETTLAATGSVVTDLAAADAIPPPPAAAPGTTATPATEGETLTYAERLSAGTPPREDVRPAEKRSAPVEAPAPKAPASTAPAATTPAPPPPAASAPSAPAASASSTAVAPAEPSGPGFAIQVAALRERGEADTVANRLIGKGFSAYVMAPAPGTPAVYRVRVGKFKERRDADAVAARLQKEEQFKPWIVR
jgi:cell division septation protein DedD